jgi:hypothetical protein
MLAASADQGTYIQCMTSRSPPTAADTHAIPTAVNLTRDEQSPSRCIMQVNEWLAQQSR